MHVGFCGGMTTSQHACCHAGWSQEHASTFSYWSVIHGLVGLFVGVVLQMVCMREWCRILILLSGAVVWELFEWRCTHKLGRLKPLLFGTEYYGDHWSNAVADVLMAIVGYGYARAFFILTEKECNILKQA